MHPLIKETFLQNSLLKARLPLLTQSLGDADVDFGGLAARVFSCDAFSECLQTAHLDLNRAPGIVRCPAFSGGPVVVPVGAQGFVSDLRNRAAILYGRPFLPVG